MQLIRSELAFIRKHGIKSLKELIKANNGAAPKGVLLLAALIKLVGTKNVARKNGALATRLHDNILRLLKKPVIREAMQVVLDAVGLKVMGHQYHGRKLVEVIGESSATGAARGAQHDTLWELQGNAPPPPYRHELELLLLQDPYRQTPTEYQRHRARVIAQDEMNDPENRFAYATQLRDYFAG